MRWFVDNFAFDMSDSAAYCDPNVSALTTGDIDTIDWGTVTDILTDSQLSITIAVIDNVMACIWWVALSAASDVSWTVDSRDIDCWAIDFRHVIDISRAVFDSSVIDSNFVTNYSVAAFNGSVIDNSSAGNVRSHIGNSFSFTLATVRSIITISFLTMTVTVTVRCGIDSNIFRYVIDNVILADIWIMVEGSISRGEETAPVFTDATEPAEQVMLHT